MNYTIELQNRIFNGFALGVMWFRIDEEYSFGEFIVYLGLISVNIKYSRI
jgi:hypothetical protein